MLRATSSLETLKVTIVVIEERSRPKLSGARLPLAGIALVLFTCQHKLRGKGVPVLGQWANGVGPRGNLYLRYKVHIPSSVTGRQRELLEEFQSIEDGDHESDQGS